MTDLLKTGSDWLADKLKAHASQSITYARDAASVTLSATIGRTEFEVASDFGVERFESRDYLVHAGDLILGGTTVLPESGDRIRETQGATTYVYEVMAPADNPPWRYSDPYRKRLRIHTKLTATESV